MRTKHPRKRGVTSRKTRPAPPGETFAPLISDTVPRATLAQIADLAPLALGAQGIDPSDPTLQQLTSTILEAREVSVIVDGRTLVYLRVE